MSKKPQPRKTASPATPKRTSRKVSLVLLLVLLPILATLSWRAWRLATPIDELLEQARRAMAAQQFEQAEALCRRVLDREPKSASALLVAGEAATKLHRLDDAVDYYSRVPIDDLLEQARRALGALRFEQAETLSRGVLDREPRSGAALLLAGEAASKSSRLDDAVRYYSRVPPDDPQAAVARLAAGSILLVTDHAAAAEQALRECLELSPNQLGAHERLASLLGIEGRRFESLPHLYQLLRLGRFTVESLRAAGNHDVAFGLEDRLRAFLATEPGDVLPLIGLARIELRRNPPEARRLLDQVLETLPEQIEAQALMGRALVALDDRAALAAWQAALPATAEAHPDIWLVRGLLAKEAGHLRAAARAFWEVLRRDPNHQAATYQLSQVLQSLRVESADRSAAAVSADDLDFLAARAVDLDRLGDTLDQLEHSQELPLIERAASLTESLGRVWESWAWHRVARSLAPNAEWATAGVARLEVLLSPDLTETLPSSDPSQRIDLSSYPLPDATHSLAQPTRPASGNLPRQPSGEQARFREVAAEAGIDFAYFRGCEPGKTTGRMYEFTGGGAAVLDFDLDGWPDIYFTQGGRWPPSTGQTEFLDQCYRNLGDGRFSNATGPAGIVEDRFSQGAAVGDFNADGFPDLYIANIGVNRLWLNCGDGTFVDATGAANIGESSWTTSCLLADLSGDGLPEVYDVNYVMGDDVFDRTCIKDGQARTCPPGIFAPQPDRLRLNLGDGQFADRSELSGVNVPGGNGLGIVAADFDGSGRLNLFVANDQDANFYFVNQGAGRDGSPRFAELGVLSGLAFDRQGKAQACMGVGAGDANGDGKLDLFVTNFHHEANTLYLQQAPDLFEDAAAASGLSEPSYEMLGFGTQFIDGELDGFPDLIVSNGHVDDFRTWGTPYAMRPQYFHNQGGGSFVEIDAKQLGEFFAALHVGRGLARLDFNRDGREDFVVSHIDEPAALVANATKPAGHFLALQLHGTRSPRDAIGARVRLTANGQTWTQQLTAGDGYMASNQRQLVFGLGQAAIADELTIDWPSGRRQTFEKVDVDREWIIVEGRDELYALPR